MQERGVCVDHSFINRWAVRFLPLLEKVFRKHKRPVGGSWRMDETYIKVKGVWKYLYRAVDKEGKTIDFLLTGMRSRPNTFISRQRDRTRQSRHGEVQAVATAATGLTGSSFRFLKRLRCCFQRKKDTARPQALGNA